MSTHDQETVLQPALVLEARKISLHRMMLIFTLGEIPLNLNRCPVAWVCFWLSCGFQVSKCSPSRLITRLKHAHAPLSKFSKARWATWAFSGTWPISPPQKLAGPARDGEHWSRWREDARRQEEVLQNECILGRLCLSYHWLSLRGLLVQSERFYFFRRNGGTGRWSISLHFTEYISKRPGFRRCSNWSKVICLSLCLQNLWYLGLHSPIKCRGHL